MNSDKMQVILLTGTEDYLLSKKLKELKACASMSVDITELISPNDIEVVMACEALPFGERRVVVVYGDIFKSEASNLIDYIKKPNPSTLLVLVSPICDKRKVLFKTIEKHGRIYEYEKLKGNELTEFIESFLKERGMRFEKDIPALITEKTGYHFAEEAKLGEIVSDLEHLCNCANNGVIDKPLIDRIIHAYVDTNVFRFIHLLSKRKFDEGMIHLKGLLDSGINELQILALIQRHFRILFKLKIVEDKSKLGLAPFMMRDFSDIDKLPLVAIQDSIKLITEKIKGIKAWCIEPRLAVETLVAELSLIYAGGGSDC